MRAGRRAADRAVPGATDSVYALDNFDPASGANVLSRGLIGDLQGERVVASPIYKHHFALTSGRCLEDPTFSVSAYPTRVTRRRVLRSKRRARLRAHAPGGRRQRHGGHAHGRGAAEARRRRSLTTSPCSAPSRAATTTASCCRPCCRARSRRDDIMLHRPDWYTRARHHAAFGRSDRRRSTASGARAFAERRRRAL